MNKLLSKHNLSSDSASYYCTVPGELQIVTHTRCTRNRQTIWKKKNSLTHYELLPKKQYVQNNPNKIYEFEECDTLSRYPNDKTIQIFLNLQNDLSLQNMKILNLEMKRFLFLDFS
jgi:hypothetical protein